MRLAQSEPGVTRWQWQWGRLLVRFVMSDELWYITVPERSRHYCYFRLGYQQDAGADLRVYSLVIGYWQLIWGWVPS